VTSFSFRERACFFFAVGCGVKNGAVRCGFGRTIKIGALTAVLTLVHLLGAQEVFIPDPALNAAVREALNKPTGDLLRDDLLRLTVLHANRKGVESLAGLEAAENLIELSARFNRISTINLEKFLNLTKLDLYGNQLTNIAVPEGLMSLVTLNLGNNRLTHFSLPPALTNITTLELGENRLARIDLPQGLAALTILGLYGNNFTELNLPDGLSSIKKIGFGYCPMRGRLTLPRGMTNLIELSLSTSISFLQVPGDLIRLERLLLAHDEITDYSFLTNLPGLTELGIGNNAKVRNLKLPMGLTNLTSLSIGGSPSLTVTLPADLVNLTNLFVSVDRLWKLDLPLLPNLKEFRVRRAAFSDFSFLSNAPALAKMDIDDNLVVEDLSFLRAMTNLSVLYVQGNPLTNFSFLGDLPHLTELRIDEIQARNLVLQPAVASSAELHVYANSMTNLHSLTNLRNFSGLSLSSLRHPFDLQILNQFPTLTSLSLSVDSTELELPDGLTNLTSLSVMSGNLKTVHAPRSLTRLTIVDLSFCYDLSDFSFLGKFPNLASLRFYNAYGPTNIALIALPSGLTNLSTSFHRLLLGGKAGFAAGSDKAGDLRTSLYVFAQNGGRAGDSGK
jgi:internalin A